MTQREQELVTLSLNAMLHLREKFSPETNLKDLNFIHLADALRWADSHSQKDSGNG